MPKDIEDDTWLQGAAPDGALSPALKALWWARRGTWDQAHELVQDAGGAEAAWVHAWLHRVEGDEGNAAYWYRRANRPAALGSTDAEWVAIVRELHSRDRAR